MEYRVWVVTWLLVPVCCALVYHLDWAYLGILVVATVSSVVLGAFAALVGCILLSHKHRSKPRLPVEVNYLKGLVAKQEEHEKSRTPSKPAVVFTRSIDTALQEIMDLIMRDYVSSWLRDITVHHDTLVQLFRDDLWTMLKNTQERLSRIDYVKFLTADVMNHVTQHFEKIRFAQATPVESKGKCAVFHLYPHLRSLEDECEYLRKVSELLLVTLFPPTYTQCQPIRKLLREVLACSILLPAADMLCDPDYINLKLIHYIQQQQAAVAQHRRTYTYAASYEDFIHMIHDCASLDDLKHIRYNIMTEIMQATTISNLKRAKGMDPDKESIPQGTGKGDLLQVLSFQVIMESAFTRRYFYRYLEEKGWQALLGFWGAVEELHHAEKKLWHQLGAEIFYTYIHSPSRGIKVDKAILKRMGSFLTGDKGPEVFYEVQEEAWQTLEHQHYPSFLVSDIYHRMLTDAEESGVDFMQPGSVEEVEQSGESTESSSTLHLCDHSSFARRKLDQIDERLVNKSQALQALRGSLKAESRVLGVVEKEVEGLQEDRRQLDTHLRRTEAWGELLGQWRARVITLESLGALSGADSGAGGSDDSAQGPVPTAATNPSEMVARVVVHLPGGRCSPPQDPHAHTAWQLVRRAADFHDLQRKLSQLVASVKSLDLPSSQQSKPLFGKGNEKGASEKGRQQLQKFLDVVLQDERLNKCEALYAFLSPSPEHLKQALPSSPKKAKFSFTTLFRSSASSETKDGSKDSDEEDSLLLDEPDGGSSNASNLGSREDRRDSIAEPLYALVSEVFDQRGVFKWLRRTLITFVQITYGRTISRQLRETAAWLVSETMVVYYLQLFARAWWPVGELVKGGEGERRSWEEKVRTRGEARDMVLSSIPEVLANLVGQQNARRGALKVFDCLQDARLNKQLFYNMLESFIYELCPELRRHGEA